MQRILLTNDDGVDALGIRVLAEALLMIPDIEVYVVAPNEEKSGVGHGVTFREALSPKRHDFYGLPVQAYGINGNPADCVKAAYYLLFDKENRPDLVLSGINVGCNLGKDVYYSGTCSAAREAVILGMPSVALSYDNYHDPDSYGEAKNVIQPLLKHFIEMAKKKEMPKQVFWNVNIPDLPMSEVRGIAPAELAFDFYQDVYHQEEAGFWLRRAYAEQIDLHGENEDFRLLKAGFITLTPVHIDSTDRDILRQTSEWSMIREFNRGR
ncbi:5'/3'-nucleotidase SurE [Brevibacillus daliensis]|uniref:5'/3'-nucleotidase SurE n=1 Tax=Brevibacillus daliensis TaxID=2892995 RepID=UPI001E3B2065|nr:5'/3'-nucleotidase SurE [Brevibacillus daliensis]